MSTNEGLAEFLPRNDGHDSEVDHAFGSGNGDDVGDNQDEAPLAAPSSNRNVSLSASQIVALVGDNSDDHHHDRVASERLDGTASQPSTIGVDRDVESQVSEQQQQQQGNRRNGVVAMTTPSSSAAPASAMQSSEQQHQIMPANAANFRRGGLVATMANITNENAHGTDNKRPNDLKPPVSSQPHPSVTSVGEVSSNYHQRHQISSASSTSLSASDLSAKRFAGIADAVQADEETQFNNDVVDARQKRALAAHSAAENEDDERRLVERRNDQHPSMSKSEGNTGTPDCIDVSSQHSRSLIDIHHYDGHCRSHSHDEEVGQQASHQVDQSFVADDDTMDGEAGQQGRIRPTTTANRDYLSSSSGPVLSQANGDIDMLPLAAECVPNQDSNQLQDVEQFILDRIQRGLQEGLRNIANGQNIHHQNAAPPPTSAPSPIAPPMNNSDVVTVHADNVEIISKNNTTTQHHDSNDQNSNQRSKRRYFMITCAAISVAVIAIVVLLVVFVFSDNSNGNSSSGDGEDKSIATATLTFAPTGVPTDGPTDAPTTASPTSAPTTPSPTTSPTEDPLYVKKRGAILEILEPLLAGPPTSTSSAQFSDPLSFHYMALDWLSRTDQVVDIILALSNIVDKDRLLLERFVLVYLYFAWDGPQWIDQCNFLSPTASVCDWNDRTYLGNGIWCDNDGLVEELILQQNRLTGRLDAIMYHLDLKFIWLFDNKIDGSISSYIGEIDRLVGFEIERNPLTGTIPTEVGNLSSLRWLQLFISNINGTIPTELGRCTRLESLEINSNELEGTIPSELGELTALTDLFLGQNNVQGTVPTELSQLTLLGRFYINVAMITGNLDPLFCTGPNEFRDIQFFYSDCESHGSSLPGTVCSCCTHCCDQSDTCTKQPVQPAECDGNCVVCGDGIFANECQECPVADSSTPDQTCTRSCALNETSGICETRTEFG